MRLGSYPRLLALALALPEMSHAMGLGHMRVESKLNEPLSAQIDIIGATPDELKAIRATVANPEIFQRYSAERPAFLSSAMISVGTDANGKPVLNIQSTDAFTEPLVEFLIDLHWGREELVRDYSLLLDPARAAPAIAVGVAAVSNDVPAPLVQAPAPDAPRIVLASSAAGSVAPAPLLLTIEPVTVTSKLQHLVVAHDTLAAIARHAGAHSVAEQQRMMLAIFQANPEAFSGNINRLHLGALIQIPSAAEIQVFDSADVEHEIRAQMTAWRRGERPAPARPVATLALTQSESAAARAPALQDTEVSAALSAMNKLDGQVQFLQQTLGETTRQLATANAQISSMERRTTQNVQAAGTGTAVQSKAATGRTSLSAMLGALALLVGGLAFACRRFLSGRSSPRKAVRVEEPTLEAVPLNFNSLSATSSRNDATDAYSVTESMPILVAPAASPESSAHAHSDSADAGATVELTQVMDINVDTVEERVPGGGDDADTLVMESREPRVIEAMTTALDYNLSDLDARAQHVEMPGSLHDHVVVVERRKNVVDSLMAAIQRDPTRYDLRMKLLETLYSAAATNLRAFNEVVRDLARHPDHLKAGDWEQIMVMGRHIAADDALFAEQAADDNIADCA